MQVPFVAQHPKRLRKKKVMYVFLHLLSSSATLVVEVSNLVLWGHTATQQPNWGRKMEQPRPPHSPVVFIYYDPQLHPFPVRKSPCSHAWDTCSKKNHHHQFPSAPRLEQVHSLSSPFPKTSPFLDHRISCCRRTPNLLTTSKAVTINYLPPIL